MAEKRMFSKTIVDSDDFLELTPLAQLLYFHISMRADDDGFVNCAKRIRDMIGATDKDMEALETKRFIIIFESGIVAIRHWKVNNTIRTDRYKPTVFTEEKSLVCVGNDGIYKEVGKPMVNQMATNGKPMVNQMATNGKPMVNQMATNGKPMVNQNADNCGETCGKPCEEHVESDGKPMVNQWYTQNRLDKDRLDKISLEKKREENCAGAYVEVFSEQEKEMLLKVIGPTYANYEERLRNYLAEGHDVHSRFGLIVKWHAEETRGDKSGKP